MSDLTDAELELALNGECHSVEVVIWLAREVKRARDAQRSAVHAGDSLHEDVRGAAIRALDRHLIGTATLGMAIRNRIADAIAVKVVDKVVSLMAKPQKELPEIFPFVTLLHREVVLRPKDGKSQDIEMSPAEADHIACLLREVAGGAHGTQTIQLSGNAPLEIFLLPVLRHKDGESQDITFTLDEAKLLADQLCAAATAARAADVDL